MLGMRRAEAAQDETPMGQSKLIVGLGNPGKEYERTRHNIGFMVIDSLARSLNIEVRNKKFGALFGQGEYQDNKLIFLKPQEYMNQSGQAVATAAGFYKLPPGDILVITDDMALEPGLVRVRAQGSAGGHNGLADIIQKLCTDNFARVRVGIGRNPYDAKDYVLGVPSPQQQELIDKGIEKAHKAVLCWVNEGINAAMNKYNAKEQ